MAWLMSCFRRWRVSILVLLAMAGIWQILSMVFTAEAVPGEPTVPGWHIVFIRTLLSLSDYWQGGLGVPSVASGAPQSYPAAILSILSHSLDTIGRLYTGLLMGGVIGSALGIGWAAVLGTECLGAQSGLGYIIIYSERFACLDRMFVATLIFVFYSAVSCAIVDRLAARLLRWTPRAGRVIAHG